MKPADSIKAGGVRQYIAKHPKEVQEKLNEIRSAIQEAAPGSKETVSYFQMPGYYYEGYEYNGMFAWFSFKKPNVRLHVRPVAIEIHKAELKGYTTTKAIVNFPATEEIPSKLVKKLVRESIGIMKKNKE